MNSVRLTLGEVGVYYDESVRSWITFTNDLYNEYSQDIRLNYIKDRLLYERREPTCEEVRILNEVVKDQYIANNVDPIYINKLTNNFICRNGVVALNGVIWDINNGLVPSGNVAEYQTLLDRATTLAITKPSSGQQAKQNTLMGSIKTAGVLPDIDVMWMFANDAGLDYSTLNWITPSLYQCTPVNSPTWTSNAGVEGNGTTSYLNTNFATNQAVQATTSSVSFLAVFDTFPGTVGGIEFGTAGAAIGFSLFYRQVKLIDGGEDGGTNFDPEPPTVGTWVGNKTGTDVTVYKNNSLVKTGTHAAGGAHEYPLFIGAINEGAPAQYCASRVRCLIIGKALDSTKRTALYNAVTTYLGSI